MFHGRITEGSSKAQAGVGQGACKMTVAVDLRKSFGFEI
jgi:hypothetical protein